MFPVGPHMEETLQYDLKCTEDLSTVEVNQLMAKRTVVLENSNHIWCWLVTKWSSTVIRIEEMWRDLNDEKEKQKVLLIPILEMNTKE